MKLRKILLCVLYDAANHEGDGICDIPAVNDAWRNQAQFMNEFFGAEVPATNLPAGKYFYHYVDEEEITKWDWLYDGLTFYEPDAVVNVKEDETYVLLYKLED